MDAHLLSLTDADFPIAIIEHCKQRKGSVFRAHAHNSCLQLFYFTGGHAHIRCGKAEFAVQPDDIVLANRGEVHHCTSDSDELRYFVLRINLEVVRASVPQAIYTRYGRPIDEGTLLFEHRLVDPAIRRLLDRMISALRQQDKGYELTLMGLCYELISQLLNCHTIAQLPRDAAMFSKQMSRFGKVLDYIDQYYEQDIVLRDLADIACMSQGYFCRTFKDMIGCTAIDYLNRTRVEKAIVLLNKRDMSIDQVSRVVGYDNADYFRRLFKRYMHETPGDYLRDSRKLLL